MKMKDMEIVKKTARQEFICSMARGNCIALLKSKPFLAPEFIADVCEFVSGLCKRFPDKRCQKQSEICHNAALALRNGDEEKHIALCEEACKSCPFVVRVNKSNPKKENSQKAGVNLYI